MDKPELAIIKDPDREDVIRRVEAAAWDEGKECEHCNGTGRVSGGRRIVHSFLGGFGADWDVDGIVELVRSSPAVAWGPGFVDHDLAVMNGDRKWLKFNVPHPGRTADGGAS